MSKFELLPHTANVIPIGNRKFVIYNTIDESPGELEYVCRLYDDPDNQLRPYYKSAYFKRIAAQIPWEVGVVRISKNGIITASWEGNVVQLVNKHAIIES